MDSELREELQHEKVIETLLPVCKAAGIDIDEYADKVEQLISQSNCALIERIRSKLPKDVRPYLANRAYYDGRESMLDDVTAVLMAIEKGINNG